MKFLQRVGPGKIYHILNRASSYENRFLKYSSQKKERKRGKQRKKNKGREGERKEERREGSEERRRERRGEDRRRDRPILPVEARNMRERAGREGQSVVTRAIFLCAWNIILSSPYLSAPQV